MQEFPWRQRSIMVKANKVWDKKLVKIEPEVPKILYQTGINKIYILQCLI